MSKKKKSNFIPAPFRVITEYENSFIESWRNNTARAVTEIIKYMADVTSATIKDKNDIQF